MTRKNASETVELEITPEMIEAGVCELAHFNPREDDFEAAVLSIFEAMWIASNKIPDRDRPEIDVLNLTRKLESQNYT